MLTNFYNIVDFEALSLAPESFNNGSDGSGGFTNKNTFFNNVFNPRFQSWSGWSYSNTTDTTTPGFLNQYSASTGGGFGIGKNYAVAFNFNPGSAVINLPKGYSLDSARITNTTYAALSILNGDQFAKKFGGANGNDPDFFKLTINGLDASNKVINTVDFNLADYRSPDNSKDFVVKDWELVDLSSLNGAEKLTFTLTSSDNNIRFGLNTPAYFALDDLILVESASVNNGKRITGTSSNDVLRGGSNSDNISGLDGNDRIFGNDGNDRVYGGVGNDFVSGGDGNDILSGDDGQDTLFGDDGDDILRGGNGEDLLFGGEGNDRLEGQRGNDTLKGGDGNDTLFGEQGNDYLSGQEGNDVLLGGIGEDTLEGGYGKDTLTGGIGADIFKFSFSSYESSTDTITDFTSGVDKIFLSRSDRGDLKQNSFVRPEQFTLGTSAKDADDRFIYDNVSGQLFFDRDGIGSSRQVLILSLANAPTLKNTDIFI